MARVIFGGMEFEGEDAASIAKGTEALAASISKVADAVNGVKECLGQMGQKSSLFYAEMLRAAYIAESFMEDKFTIRPSQEADLRNSFPNKKIQAIKMVREITSMHLKEAKDLVDKYWPSGCEGLLSEIRSMRRPSYPDVRSGL